VQRQDRVRGDVPQERMGRAFPAQPTAGARIAGSDRGTAALSGDGSRHRGSYHGHSHHDHGHGHGGHCGGYWHKPYWWHWYPRSYVYYNFYVPAPTFYTTPFYCGLCSIGFAGITFFHHHLHYVHALPFADIDSYVFNVGGRIVFHGY
jgi:hypothetical protein